MTLNTNHPAKIAIKIAIDKSQDLSERLNIGQFKRKIAETGSH
jgi:hypothetical protein